MKYFSQGAEHITVLCMEKKVNKREHINEISAILLGVYWEFEANFCHSRIEVSYLERTSL